MIGMGAIILYVDVYLYIIPTTDLHAVSILCNVRALKNLDSVCF